MRDYIQKLEELNRKVVIIDGKYYIKCMCCDRILYDGKDRLIDLLDYMSKELLIKNPKCT